MRKEVKVFFFEKKKQKTFKFWRLATKRAVPLGLIVSVGHPNGRAETMHFAAKADSPAVQSHSTARPTEALRAA